jgi:hypothetical protein
MAWVWEEWVVWEWVVTWEEWVVVCPQVEKVDLEAEFNEKN